LSGNARPGVTAINVDHVQSVPADVFGGKILDDGVFSSLRAIILPPQKSSASKTRKDTISGTANDGRKNQQSRWYASPNATASHPTMKALSLKTAWLVMTSEPFLS